MRLDWRYVIIGLLVGVAVCSVVGAVGGVVAGSAGSAGGAATAGLGSVVASGLAGLIIGAALGAVLGALSGVVTTLVVGGRTQATAVSLRAGVAVGITYLVVLTGLAGLGDGSGWSPPSAVRWAGVVVPAVVAALLAGRAAREVPRI